MRELLSVANNAHCDNISFGKTKMILLIIAMVFLVEVRQFVKILIHWELRGLIFHIGFSDKCVGKAKPVSCNGYGPSMIPRGCVS